jgi:purine-nucleoside phosphorylase
MDVSAILPYAGIPGFPLSTVESHAGELVLGQLSGKNMAVMRGRFHLYEGYSAKDIAFPLRVLRLLGVHTLIVTNAAGGVGPGFRVGDLMLIR